MNTPFFPGRDRAIAAAVRLCSRLAFALCAAGPVSAALTVTPSTLANNFNGTMDLAIGGLDFAGQTVIIDKYFDSDDDGTITGMDQLVQRVKVRDGEVSSIGGKRNLNVPGDEDGSADLAILTRLRTTTGFTADRLAGRFIFRIAPDGAGFAPFSDNLTVTQSDHQGSGIMGRVIGSGSPQAGALVLFTSGSPYDFDVVAAAMTDASGNYSLKVPRGDYRLVATKGGYVFNLNTGPPVTVNAGMFTSSPDVSLTLSSRMIGGTVRDADVSHAPLPGVLIFGESQSGMFAITFSDASGNYLFPATTGEWRLGLLEWPVAQLGMLQGEEYVENSASHVFGFNLEVPRANALIFGTVRTPANGTVPYISVEAEMQSGSTEWRAVGVTDLNGNYTLGTLAGNWRVQADAPGFLGPESEVLVPAPGTALEVSVIAAPVTAHLRGDVRDNFDRAVPFTEILAFDNQGTSARGSTNEWGRFEIGVHGGPGGTEKTWTLQLSQGDDETSFIGGAADFQVNDGIDINNITYNVFTVTARLSGNLRLDGVDPPANTYQLYASAQNFSASTGSDAGSGGAFAIPVVAGNWQVGLSGQPPGVLPQNELIITVASGPGADQNGLLFHLRTATRTITGTVKNSGGAGVGGISVSATITDAGVGYTTRSFSNPDGTWEMPAFPGTWSVSLDSGDLNNRGYQAAASQNANLTAGDANVNFTVTPGGGGSPFSNWQNSFFTPADLADQNISGANADPDHDGIVNLLEYAFDLRPNVPEAGLPRVGYQPPAGPAAAFLTLTFTRLTGNSGIAYNVLEATGLSGPWTNVTASYDVLFNNGTTETVRAKTPIGPASKFLRLQVVLTSP